MDKHGSARAVFERAEAARRNVDYGLAVELYREVVRLERTHPKARARLAGLLEFKASRLVDEDLDGALEIYEEAWATDTSREKLRLRYGRALRRKLNDVMLADDHATAREVVSRARAPSDQTGPILGPGVERLVEELPLVPLHVQLTGFTGEPWIVLLDGGLDRELLPSIIHGLPDAQIYALDPPSPRDTARLPGPIRTLARATSIGFQREVELCSESDVGSARVLSELRRALPTNMIQAAGLDMLEHVSFAVDDVFFRTARDMFALQQILQARRPVLVVSGHGVVRGAVRAVLDTDPMDLPLWELWCSESLDRYDASARPLDWSLGEDELIAPSVDGQRLVDMTNGNAAHASETSEDARSWTLRVGVAGVGVAGSIGRAVGRLVRPRADVRCALLSAPNIRHVSNVVSVAASFGGNVEVVAVPVAGLARHSPTHLPYEELASQRPNTRINRSCSVVPVEDAEVTAVVNRALDSASVRAALESCVVAGFVIGSRVRRVLERVLVHRLPLLRALTLRLDDFLETERPDVLVVSPDRTPEMRVACTLARRRGIPTVFPQMAFFSRSPRYKPLQADVICVLDDHHRTLFEESFGASPEQIVVTGIARFDPIQAMRDAGLPQAPGDGSVLLVLQSLATTYNERFCDLLVETMTTLEGRLCIKLHPYDDETSYQHFVSLIEDRLPDRGRVFWKEDVHELVCASDIVVSTFSNVVLEAAMLERPVICANLTGEQLPVPFVEQGVAWGADSPAELQQCVRRAISDAAFREEIKARSAGYFAQNPHLLGGRAADRVASVVRSLAGVPPS